MEEGSSTYKFVTGEIFAITNEPAGKGIPTFRIGPKFTGVSSPQRHPQRRMNFGFYGMYILGIGTSEARPKGYGSIFVEVP